MQVNQNDRLKVFEIWLTNCEQKDPSVIALVDPLIKEWYNKGYLPVVYKSGNLECYGETLALLKHNRIVSAKRESEIDMSL